MLDQAKVCLMARPIKLTLSLTGSYAFFLFLCILRVTDIVFFQAEDGIRDRDVTGVQTCALPICSRLTSEINILSW